MRSSVWRGSSNCESGLSEGFSIFNKNNAVQCLLKVDYLEFNLRLFLQMVCIFRFVKKQWNRRRYCVPAFLRKGIQMYGESSTNQQFPILTKKQADYFAKKYIYETWRPFDQTHTIYRFLYKLGNRATRDFDVIRRY